MCKLMHKYFGNKKNNQAKINFFKLFIIMYVCKVSGLSKHVRHAPNEASSQQSVWDKCPPSHWFKKVYKNMRNPKRDIVIYSINYLVGVD